MKKISGAMSAARIFVDFSHRGRFNDAQQPAGTIRTWGSNGGFQLGDGLIGNATVPESVLGLTDVTAVAAGELF